MGYALKESTFLKGLSFYLLYPLLLLTLSNCTLPKIIPVNDPLSVEEHLKLGGIYESKGEWEDAVEEYKAALRKDRKNTKVLLFLGNAYLGMGRFDKAERYYKEVIKKRPEWGVPYNNLAWVYIKAGKDLKEAESLVEKAVLLDPDGYPAYYDTLGVIYTRLGQYRKAEDAFLKALSGADSDGREEILRHIEEVRKGLGDSSFQMEFNGALIGA